MIKFHLHNSANVLGAEQLKKIMNMEFDIFIYYTLFTSCISGRVIWNNNDFLMMVGLYDGDGPGYP